MLPLEDKVIVITGAGSGVGQAAAWKLGEEGAKLILVGRSETSLQETAVKLDTTKTLVYPCDVAEAGQVANLAKAVQEQFKRVDALVNAAGTNVPRRALIDLSYEDYRQVIEINLNGTFLCVQAFLPIMREQGEGTIINIGSVAGLNGSSIAGAAYSASKFGMRGLTQTINVEEQKNGIRACSIFPAEINTPIMDKRPNPPSAEARQKMLQSEDLAECIALVLKLPQRAVIDELTIRPLQR